MRLHTKEGYTNEGGYAPKGGGYTRPHAQASPDIAVKGAGVWRTVYCVLWGQATAHLIRSAILPTAASGSLSDCRESTVSLLPTHAAAVFEIVGPGSEILYLILAEKWSLCLFCLFVLLQYFVQFWPVWKSTRAQLKFSARNVIVVWTWVHWFVRIALTLKFTRQISSWSKTYIG